MRRVWTFRSRARGAARFPPLPRTEDISSGAISTGAAARSFFWKRIPTAVNVWKGGNESYWRLADGSRYGARSLDDSADGFNLWTEADGRQHADIPFRPAPSSIVVAPGETLSAPRPMGAILVLEP